MPNLLIWWAALQQERGRLWKCCSFSSFFKFFNIKPIIQALAAVPRSVSALESSSFWSTPGMATAAAPVPGRASTSCGAMTAREADVFTGDQRNSWGVRRGWHEGRTAVLLESLSGRWSHLHCHFWSMSSKHFFFFIKWLWLKKCFHVTPAASS